MKNAIRPLAAVTTGLALAVVLALTPSLAASATPYRQTPVVKPLSGGGGTLPGDGYDPDDVEVLPELPDRITLEVFRILLRIHGPVIYLWTEAMLETEARRLGLIN